MPELWLPIPGFDIYEASSLGNIRSIDRYVPYKGRGWEVACGLRLFKGRVLKPAFTTSAPFYKRVGLIRDGKRFDRTVHSLVCTAFHGERPHGLVCGHLNEIAHDNRSENLAWITVHENNVMVAAKKAQNLLDKMDSLTLSP